MNKNKLKRVLFYGSFPHSEYENVKTFLQHLIPELIERDYQIITREGTANNMDDGLVWLDNLVLDIACDYCAQHKIDFFKDNQIISYNLDNGTPSPHKRRIDNLPNSDRFSGYKKLMERSDIIIGIGGAGGVYRFGLVAGATNHLFIPLSIAKGDAVKLAKELYEYLGNRYSHDLEEYITRNEILSKDSVIDFVNVIGECLKKSSNDIHQITKEEFTSYLQQPGRISDLGFSDFWNLLKKLPLSWILSFSGLTLTVIVLFILRLVI